MSEYANLAAARQAGLQLAPGREFQYKLRRIQTYQWGTFNDLHDIDIAEEGHLLLGPSGSGKSTLLDAHASLLTPPKWLDFNTAARANERGSADRSLATYIRGAYANRTHDESGERIKKYLREGTAWSALCETYRDGTGRVVVLGRVLWIKGSGSTNSDARWQFFICERELSLRELEVLPQSGFDVRKLKATLSDVWFTDEFSGYQTRFMRLFGIASDRALRLLHKTQSAKDLGDLNRFLRDFMLDPPQTFDDAEKLVTEFQVLDGAHQAVLEARDQIAALKPARESLAVYEDIGKMLSVLKEEAVGIQYFREQWRCDLLNMFIKESEAKLQGLAGTLETLRNRETQEKLAYEAMLAIAAGAGGTLIADLESQLEALERSRLPEVRANESRLVQALKALDGVPPRTPEQFASMQRRARDVLDGRAAAEAESEERLDQLKERKRQIEERFATARREVDALKNRTSNMPSPLLDVRESMCRALGLQESEVPFAGELLQVKPAEAAWTGAIERVLRGFATSMLVEERLYKRVAAWVDETNLGQRLVYLRMAPHAAHPVAHPAAASLVRKLDTKPEFREWLLEELRTRFDYQCVDTSEQLQAVERGVTRAGQVKHSRTRHEKDDRRSIGDRREWVLGFSNKDKLEALRAECDDLAPEITAVDDDINREKAARDKHRDRVLSCQTLANFTWENVNTAGLLDEKGRLEQRLQREREARPELKTMEQRLGQHKSKWGEAQKDRQDAESEHAGVYSDMSKAQKRLAEIPAEDLSFTVSPTQDKNLEERFIRLLGPRRKDVTLDNIDSISHAVAQELQEAIANATREQGEAKGTLEKHLLNFRNRWPTAAQGLDATLEAAPEFMAKLDRLETDGLHEYVERFRKLLHEQSDQNLAVLHTRLDQERNAIQDRLDQVNSSLRRRRFDENTYLVIQYTDRPPREVVEFRQQLKSALAHSFKDDDHDEMERRFAELNTMVQKLGSGKPEDIRWRNLVLDVRQHVEFSAIEFDDTGIEVERHDSGSGKSGGQRQKLATTCLAAALCYQLAGEEGDWPSFSTVVMDEAFDHTDNEYTGMVMNIFKNLGFQVVAATPVKNVMALEPFIGGGTFVSIRERKYSEVLPIKYLADTNRLDLPEEAQAVLADELAEEDEASS
jgi:uncharacterized protein YPO0396